MLTLLHRHRFSFSDYHKMAETGILAEDDRVELIEGEIIDMSPIGHLHASCVRRLIDLLHPQLRAIAILDVQNPIRLNDHSEPQPDLTLLRPRADFYRSSQPRAEDVLLLVEIADTSLSYDWDVKVPLYARHTVPEVWLFDLNQPRLEIFLDPSPGGYKKLLRPEVCETIAPSLLPEVAIDLQALLG